MTAQIDIKKAMDLYNKSGLDVKLALKELFGDKLDPLQYLDTFESICKYMGVSTCFYEIKDFLPNKKNAEICLDRLNLIAAAYNGDWVADLLDVSQDKYYPLHRIILDASRPFGFRLSFADCGCGLGFAFLGARPFYKDEATMRHVEDKYKGEYEQWAYYMNLHNKNIKR